MEGTKKYWDVKRPSHYKYYKNNTNSDLYRTIRIRPCDICKRINAEVQEEEVKETIKVTINQT